MQTCSPKVAQPLTTKEPIQIKEEEPTIMPAEPTPVTELREVPQYTVIPRKNSPPPQLQTPFKNEFIKKVQSNEVSSSALKTLKQKIIETKFTEPKSLIARDNRGEPRNPSSSKKRRIMGLPDYANQKPDPCAKFSMDGLTDKIMEKTIAGIDSSKLIMAMHGNITKKIIQGSLVSSKPSILVTP